MSKIKIPTSFNIELEFETAEFHKRLFAWLIDLTVIIAFNLAIGKIFGSLIDEKAANDDNNLPYLYNLHWIQVIIFIPPLLYHIACETFMNGQSIGKKILGIRVINENGGRPAFSQLLLRWLLRLADFWFSLFMGGLFSVLLSKKDQRLGDMAAGTLVINSRTKSDINETVFVELDESYQPRFANALMLSDRDMNIIKSILDTKSASKKESMAERAGEKISSVLGIKEYVHPIELLETVLKDYNYLSGQR